MTNATNITISPEELKKMIKDTFIEVMTERKDIIEQAVIEAIEDIGLAKAMAEGIKSPSVSESEIFGTLDAVK